MAYNVGLVGPYDFDGVIQNDFFAAAVLFLNERCPLVSRLPNRATRAATVKQVDDAYRPNSLTLIAAANNAQTSITLSESAPFQAGDVIQIDDELLQVTAINSAACTATVTRGHAGTTAAAHNNASTVYLIGNTRTGAEVDQDGPQRVFDSSLTYPQTSQHPYQIGGATEAKSPNMAIPMGFASLVGYQRAKSTQHVFDDLERSAYYGKAVALAADTTRPMMNGLRYRLTTNLVTSPTNSSAYKPSDFARDFLTAPSEAGGRPDVCILSDKYKNAFQVWGVNLLNLTEGASTLGVDITAFAAPSMGLSAILFSPLLRPYDGFSLTSDECSFGWVREPFDKPRGSRGDATEGDIIGEGCLVVNNESHHAFVTGVTAFAKQS